MESGKLTGRPIAVFDLDGCLMQNPYEDQTYQSTQNVPGGRFDPDFWHRHWTADGQVCHSELVDLARTLLSGGYAILVLTARPDTYANQTIRWLQQVGPWEVICHNDGMRHGATGHSVVHLLMIPSRVNIAHAPSSAEWKRDAIRKLMARGCDIRFVVEDHKPNADVIREVVPVLLYERQKTKHRAVRHDQNCICESCMVGT
jgi:hypothetical protein